MSCRMLQLHCHTQQPAGRAISKHGVSPSPRSSGCLRHVAVQFMAISTTSSMLLVLSPIKFQIPSNTRQQTYHEQPAPDTVGLFAAHLFAFPYKPTCTTIMSSSTLLMLPAGSSSSSGMTSASMGTTGGRGSILHASTAMLQG